ncbi:hypothetical protein MKX34_24125 [Paenibacillus sp. FSL R5-0636]|uniref:hypothetical protein n=1 Tax=Paenibacillus TaxID=44249 RepID=UPI0015C2EA55|nr:hypothetical protein [Paenibacillus odorifer]
MIIEITLFLFYLVASLVCYFVGGIVMMDALSKRKFTIAIVGLGVMLTPTLILASIGG